ncbi:YciI family protein [Actinoplanes sp. RD1]|uniref:YciI family protein n=1 Tax=Actinoplanes sp. RD1 TaxID=3064538 RepID=UPI0027410A24|nr:YciI family protein [Actinoplanes sp. RD1]
MRYLVLLKAAHPATPPPPELMAAIAQLGEDATRSGALLDTAGLAPSADGVRVVVGGGEVSTTDGPFAEAKEMISYALYDVASKEEATAWATRFMRAHADAWPGWEGEAQILRVFGPQDFAPPA